jgi:polysaccharide transporter, PST family
MTGLRRLRAALRHPISRNVISLYWLQIAQFIVPIVTLPYVARVLEPSSFGLVVFSQSFAFVLILFIDWGFGFTGTRSVAESQDDPGALARIVQRVRGGQLLLAFASVPVTVAAVLFVVRLNHHPGFVAMAWIAAVSSALVPAWFFVGIEQPRMMARVQLGLRALGAVLTLLLVRGPGDAWIVMALFSASSVLGWLVGDVMLYRRVAFRRPVLRSSFSEVRHASTLFVGMVGAALYGTFNVLLLGVLRGPVDVAHFGAAERIVRVSLTMLGPIGMAVLPRLIALQAAGRRERARRLLVSTMAATAVPVLLVTAGFIVLAPTIITIIYGHDFVHDSAPILRVLALIIPVGLTGVSFGAWLITQHRDRICTIIVLVAGLFNLALGSVLTLRFGPIGMAWSVVAAEAVAALGGFLVVVHDSRHPKEDVPSWLSPTQAQMAAAAEASRVGSSPS